MSAPIPAMIASAARCWTPWMAHSSFTPREKGAITCSMRADRDKVATDSSRKSMRASTWTIISPVMGDAEIPLQRFPQCAQLGAQPAAGRASQHLGGMGPDTSASNISHADTASLSDVELVSLVPVSWRTSSYRCTARLRASITFLR